MCLERISRPLYAHQAYAAQVDQPSILDSIGRIILSAGRAFAIIATGASTFGFITSGNPLFLGGAIVGGAISFGLFSIGCDDPFTALYEVIRLIGATTNGCLDAFSPRTFSYVPRPQYYQPPVYTTFHQTPILDITQRAPVGRREDPDTFSTAVIPISTHDAASRAQVGVRSDSKRNERAVERATPAIPIFREPFPIPPRIPRLSPETLDTLSRATVGRREDSELAPSSPLPIESAADVTSRAQVGSRKDR